jgi:hypothetical protein
MIKQPKLMLGLSMSKGSDIRVKMILISFMTMTKLGRVNYATNKFKPKRMISNTWIGKSKEAYLGSNKAISTRD